MKFLLDTGYKHWNTETVKGLDGYIEFFQKRMDKDEVFPYPLCATNDKILINISHSVFTIQDQKHDSYEMYLVHENQDGYWCDLKIYSLNEEDIRQNINYLEQKLLKLWGVFAEGME